MKKYPYGIIVLVSVFLLLPSNTYGKTKKSDVVKSIVKQAETYEKIAKQIWTWAEVGYQEYKSSELLQNTLENEGFSIEAGVAEIPTAFVASYGSGRPVIGILAEFDALPGLSQEITSERNPRVEGGAGHGCGHHLFGTASTAAAIAVKDWIKSSEIGRAHV